jgi:hypothetical protein
LKYWFIPVAAALPRLTTVKFVLNDFVVEAAAAGRIETRIRTNGKAIR